MKDPDKNILLILLCLTRVSVIQVPSEIVGAQCPYTITQNANAKGKFLSSKSGLDVGKNQRLEMKKKENLRKSSTHGSSKRYLITKTRGGGKSKIRK